MTNETLIAVAAVVAAVGAPLSALIGVFNRAKLTQIHIDLDGKFEAAILAAEALGVAKERKRADAERTVAVAKLAQDSVDRSSNIQ